MSFKRIWDDSCPREYDRWEQDGTTFVIQDLPPEDDKEALRILFENFLPDSVLWNSSSLPEDPESIQCISDGWMETIKKRMTLACYAEKDGHRSLVALNVCLPKYKDDTQAEIVGKKFKNMFYAIMHIEDKAKSMEVLDLDLALTAYGLVVIKDYRGKKLGYKVLAASVSTNSSGWVPAGLNPHELIGGGSTQSREQMCRSLGIKGTTTIFTNIVAQKLAARAGFKSIFEISIKEFANIGLDYPENDERIIKVMIRKYE